MDQHEPAIFRLGHGNSPRCGCIIHASASLDTASCFAFQAIARSSELEIDEVYRRSQSFAEPAQHIAILEMRGKRNDQKAHAHHSIQSILATNAVEVVAFT
jgi:hypothetical protein